MVDGKSVSCDAVFTSAVDATANKIVYTLTTLDALKTEDKKVVNVKLSYEIWAGAFVSEQGLSNIVGIILKNLRDTLELVVYDNKKLDLSNLYEFISELRINFKLDLIYYYTLANYLIDNGLDISDEYFDKVSFVDGTSDGLCLS